MRHLWILALLVPGLALAATPSEGVELKVRRGFFTETDIGAFFTLGGGQRYSNAQTYLQLGIGYDINDTIELGVNFGIGASAADCFGAVSSSSGNCVQADNFTVAMIDLNAAYLFKLADRFYLTPKLAGGYTTLDPAPVVDSNGNPLTSGVNVGAGLGIEYATYMDHFSVGLEVMFRFVIGPNIPTMSIFPRVKYTF